MNTSCALVTLQALRALLPQFKRNDHNCLCPSGLPVCSLGFSRCTSDIWPDGFLLLLRGFPQHCNTVGSSLFFLFWLSAGVPKPYIPLDISGVVLKEISRSQTTSGPIRKTILFSQQLSYHCLSPVTVRLFFTLENLSVQSSQDGWSSQYSNPQLRPSLNSLPASLHTQGRHFKTVFVFMKAWLSYIPKLMNLSQGSSHDGMLPIGHIWHCAPTIRHSEHPSVQWNVPWQSLPALFTSGPRLLLARALSQTGTEIF